MKIKKIIIYLTVVLTITSLALIIQRYKSFHKSINVFKEIKLSNTKADVLYRLGEPAYILGPKGKGEGLWGKAQTVYHINNHEYNENSITYNTQIHEYNEWVYEESISKDHFTVVFNTNGLVESLMFYSNTTNKSAWGPIAGVCNGDDENKILRLGEPSINSIEGTVKTIEFSDIGLAFNLKKGRVFMVEVRNSKNNAYSTLVRFVNSFF